MSGSAVAFALLAVAILLALRAARMIDLPSGGDAETATNMACLESIAKQTDSLEPGTDEGEIEIAPVYETIDGGETIDEDGREIWM